MTDFRFKIISKNKKSFAKLGKIETHHGTISTPAFIPVGSGASVKTLTSAEIKECKIDIFFVNTYHMIFRPGTKSVKKLGGLHQFMNWRGPVMTDSGGFQAFSLGEFGPRNAILDPKSLVQINDLGIRFKSAWDGRTQFLGPKESISAQQDLGSDIMMAFDECTFYPIKKERATSALERTHHWALKCLEQKVKGKGKQALYGIIQGSVFQDLRQKSAQFLSKLPFEGFAIGSVANSSEPRSKVFTVLDWTMPILLTKQKPIHFLGIGEIEDIFIGIQKGIDSFDCVTPTRLGRMGWIFSKKMGLKNKFRYDITKTCYFLDRNPPEKNCPCFTCKNFTKAYLHHLFRNKELLAYRLTSYHNLFFFGNLMEKIRMAISENRYDQLKKEWLE